MFQRGSWRGFSVKIYCKKRDSGAARTVQTCNSSADTMSYSYNWWSCSQHLAGRPSSQNEMPSPGMEQLSLRMERLPGQRVDPLRPVTVGILGLCYKLGRLHAHTMQHLDSLSSSCTYVSWQCRHREVHLGTEKSGGSDDTSKGDFPLLTTEESCYTSFWCYPGLLQYPQMLARAQ